MKTKLMVVGALFAAACASQKAPAKLDDSGLSRLTEQQMGPVDDARIEAGRAHDAVSRARANEAESRSRVEVARSERAVGDAQLKRAIAERDMLKKAYAEPNQLARAEEEISAYQQRLKATDLKLQYLERMIGVAESERKAAEAHEVSATARVEQAKYRAMTGAGARQATSVNGGDLDKRLAEAQVQEAQVQKEAAERRSGAIDLYNRWQEVDARVQTLAKPSALTPPPPPQAEPTR